MNPLNDNGSALPLVEARGQLPSHSGLWLLRNRLRRWHVVRAIAIFESARSLFTIESTACGADDGGLLVYDTSFSGKPADYLLGHTGAATDMDMNSDATLLLSCDAGGTVLAWRRVM